MAEAFDNARPRQTLNEHEQARDERQYAPRDVTKQFPRAAAFAEQDDADGQRARDEGRQAEGTTKGRRGQQDDRGRDNPNPGQAPRAREGGPLELPRERLAQGSPLRQAQGM